MHPLNEEWAKGAQPNKLPSPSETRLSLAKNGTFRWDTGGLAQASDTVRGELAGSSGQCLFPPLGSWEQWELRAVITGPDRAEGSSD